MTTELIPREEKSHGDVDLTVPVNYNQIMAADREKYGDTCFSHLWDMGEEKCVLCGDNEVCGILYTKRMQKVIKEQEKKMAMVLDTVGFDRIDRTEILLWLKLEPRTKGQFARHISELSDCKEVETVRYWVNSFLVDNPKLSVNDKKQIVVKK